MGEVTGRAGTGERSADSPERERRASRSAPPDRVILFGNPFSFVSTVLVDAAIRAARQRGDMEVVAVCDAGHRAPAPTWVRSARRVLAGLAKRVFDPSQRPMVRRPMLDSLAGAARRWKVPLIVPPERSVNHPGFIELLRRELRPTIGLALECLQIFGGELLGCFDLAVNYHNGTLPGYRGLRCTGWSVYNGETVTSFTFHHMERDVDAGPTLLRGDVPVTPGARLLQLEWNKTTAAARALPELLELLSQRAAGSPQDGQARYYSARRLRRATTIDEPSAMTAAELDRRLRAFDMVTLRLAGRSWEVTRLATASRRSPLAFVTADGVRLRPARCLHLPVALYRLLPGRPPGWIDPDEG